MDAADTIVTLDRPPLMRPSPRRWLIAAVLMAAVVFGFFDRISVAVLFTWVPFQDAMGTGFNPARLGLLMTVFLLAYGVSAIFLSFPGDMFGHRRALAVSSAVWGLAMAGMGLVNSYGLMLVGRAVLGLAEGPQFSFANALVGRWFPRNEQARASSFWLVGSPLGSALGFPLVAFLVTSQGWRAAFVILGLLNLAIVLPLILAVVREWPPGMQQVVTKKPSAAEYRRVVAGLLRDWRFGLLVVYNIGSLIYIWGLNAWLPTYLVKSLGIDLRSAGMLASAPFACMFIGEIAGAMLADRIGRHAFISGCGLTFAAIMMYVGTTMPTAHAAVLAMAASAFGQGVAIPTFFACSLRVLPPGAVAAGIGVCNGIGNLAGAAAPLAIGMLIASTGSFESGLLVLVAAPLLSASALFTMAALRVGR